MRILLVFLILLTSSCSTNIGMNNSLINYIKFGKDSFGVARTKSVRLSSTQSDLINNWLNENRKNWDRYHMLVTMIPNWCISLKSDTRSLCRYGSVILVPKGENYYSKDLSDSANYFWQQFEKLND